MQNLIKALQGFLTILQIRRFAFRNDKAGRFAEQGGN